MANLKGKVAWVTGAGTGIGEGAALALARDGATVVLTGRRTEALQAVADKISKAGGKASVQPADVTKAAAVQKVADAIRAEHGRLDIVVNNAGMNIPDRTWQRLKAEGADAVITGNLIAFIAGQPAHVCINEIVVSPTHNRGYIGIMKAREAALAAARK